MRARGPLFLQRPVAFERLLAAAGRFFEYAEVAEAEKRVGRIEIRGVEEPGVRSEMVGGRHRVDEGEA